MAKFGTPPVGHLLLPSPGWVAEWLGKGLQNLVRRFESAPNLILKPRSTLVGRGFLVGTPHLRPRPFIESLVLRGFLIKCYFFVDIVHNFITLQEAISMAFKISYYALFLYPVIWLGHPCSLYLCAALYYHWTGRCTVRRARDIYPGPSDEYLTQLLEFECGAGGHRAGDRERS